MNTNPTNYSDWVKIFDCIEAWEIGHIDSEINLALKKGSIKWVSGTAERFTNNLLNLMNSRFDKLNKFYNDRCSKFYDSFEFSKTLITFRRELVFLKQLANANPLPNDIKQKLTQNITEFAKNAQKNLEDGAKKDLSGEMKRIILGNRIDSI